VARDVHDVLAGSPADLIETVAERIAAAALAYPAVQAVDVRVHKPHAPIPVPFDDVEVAVRRDRVRTPVVEAPGARTAEPVPVPVASPEPAATAVAAIEPVADPASTPVPPPPAAKPEPPRDPLDQQPTQPVDVVIALGANLGEAQRTLRQAVTDVDRIPGLQVMEVSPLARTAAVGPEQPDYLNAVLLARTTLSPRELLRACQQVEQEHGRVRAERWGPRTLDVDIVQYGGLVASADDLELPHPRARERAFVLVPWAEVDPGAVLHGLGGGPVARLAETAPDRPGIRWLALDWLADPQDTVSPHGTGPQAGTGAVHAPVPPAPEAGR
jgi:dihydroneopterin aldolase/2-amino-4-hydroxy-6-hydroxymethyldihydropteridine diphosphokinase